MNIAKLVTWQHALYNTMHFSSWMLVNIVDTKQTLKSLFSKFLNIEQISA